MPDEVVKSIMRTSRPSRGNKDGTSDSGQTWRVSRKHELCHPHARLHRPRAAIRRQSHEARSHGLQLQSRLHHHHRAGSLEAQLVRHQGHRAGGRSRRHGGAAAGRALERLWRAVELQQLHIRELHLGVGDRRGDELLHGARHRPRAAGASADGGQDGGHHRSRHRWPLRHERGVRMVQERIRHVRRPHAPARRPLQIRHRMARFRAPGMDARTRSSISPARTSMPPRSGASPSRCRSPIRRS